MASRARKQTLLGRAVAALSKAFGPPPAIRTRTAFEAIVLENCAYLVDDDRRAAVFESLRKRIGVTPAALAGAPEALLIDLLAPGGMNGPARVEKIRGCAELALEIGAETLEQKARRGSADAKKLLKRFSGIGDPGAEKILLLAGGQTASVAPDSNGLRVLVRLGVGEEARDYTKSYRSAVEAARGQLSETREALLSAHSLLRRHGQDVCKRSSPRCEECPLTEDCRDYQSRLVARG